MYYKNLVLVTVMAFLLLSQTTVYTEDGHEFLTRAELANVAMETYEYITQEFSLPNSEQPIFNDINESQYGIRIEQAYINGFMSGVEEKQFSPNELVTKGQATTVLYRLIRRLNTKYGNSLEERETNINDINEVPEWAIEASTYMVSTGLVSLNEGDFLPNELMEKNTLNEITDKIKNTFVTDDNEERMDFQTFLERMQQK